MYDDKKKKWTKAQYHENLKKNNTKRGGGGEMLNYTLVVKTKLQLSTSDEMGFANSGHSQSTQND